MIVQIYEIQNPVEARAMIDLGVDHIGTVLLSAQRWQDEILKQTIEAVQAAGRKSSLIPLFHDLDLITQAIEYYKPDIIHFCEALPWGGNGGTRLRATLERQASIRLRFPDLQIMRSISIARQGLGAKVPSLELAARFESISDFFLTDTVLVENTPEACMETQPVDGFVGITGQTCDWSVANQLVQASRIPVILAGGLGPLNVTQGVVQVCPAGVDSCTRTNALDAAGKPVRFKKDPDKVRALVVAARAAAGEAISNGSYRGVAG